MTMNNSDKFNKTVTIPNPLYQSLEGRYFVGQTETIRLGKGKYAWGGLINPSNTISNHSNEPIIAQIWFNPIIIGKSMISDKVTPADTALSPLPRPKVQLKFAELINWVPKKGVNAFQRIVPPQSTLSSDEDGKFIFPPNGSFVLFLVSPNLEIVKAEIAFGWFEKKVITL